MRQPEEQRKRKRAYVKRMKKIRILFWCVFVCLFFAGTSTLLAKYYAKESRKGVATASGLYFTSNYLDNVIGEENFPERVNSNQWLGIGTCPVTIEVYNYDNILLYNDENLNITYDMHFQMLEEPDADEAYEVVYNTTDENDVQVAQRIKLEDTSQKTITGIFLPGGQAICNSVQLQVTPNIHDTNTKVDNSYRSKKVKIWVEPTEPDYVTNTYKLGAVLSVTPSKQVFSFQGAFDVNEKLEGKTVEECIQFLQSYAGFTYKLQTSGELNDSYNGKKMRITWNSTYLEMDMYNKYYQEALQENNVTTVTNNETGTTYSSFTMELVSYMSMEFDFYKTADFSRFQMSRVEDFTDLVVVEVIDETN